jgi:hypothetical protein
MFGKLRKEKPSIYDAPIAKVLQSMETFSPEDPEFTTLMAHLNELTKMKAAESAKSKVDANTMAIVGGNLLGILTIVAYEQKHVMTSKAMGFILKAK